jgi:hypothetical protein
MAPHARTEIDSASAPPPRPAVASQVSTFGAEQLDQRRPRDRRELDSYFNYFYWSINLGALCSYTLVASICQFGVKGLGASHSPTFPSTHPSWQLPNPYDSHRP